MIFLCSQVVGFDIDPDALSIAQENNEHFGTNLEFVQMNLDPESGIFPLLDRSGEEEEKEMMFDVVVTNPPFGTKKQVGVDARFVQNALRFAPVVYSLHKTSTRQVRKSRPYLESPDHPP